MCIFSLDSLGALNSVVICLDWTERITKGPIRVSVSVTHSHLYGFSFQVCESRLQSNPYECSHCSRSSRGRGPCPILIWNRQRLKDTTLSSCIKEQLSSNMCKGCWASERRGWAARLPSPKPTFAAKLKESSSHHWWPRAALLCRHHWHFHSLQF